MSPNIAFTTFSSPRCHQTLTFGMVSRVRHHAPAENSPPPETLVITLFLIKIKGFGSPVGGDVKRMSPRRQRVPPAGDPQSFWSIKKTRGFDSAGGGGSERMSTRRQPPATLVITLFPLKITDFGNPVEGGSNMYVDSPAKCSTHLRPS